MKSVARPIFVDRGKDIDVGPSNPFSDFDIPFRLFALVEISQFDACTLIRWDVDEVHPSSIVSAANQLGRYKPPFHLQYFKHAWFRETINDPESAATRIRNIGEYNGVDVIGALFIRRCPELSESAPLRRFQERYDERKDDLAISQINQLTGQCPIVHAGKNSLVSKLTNPENSEFDWRSFEANSEFDRATLDEYERILSNGRPQYDHVIAAVHPINETEPVWISYQRTAAPIHVDSFGHSVAVLCKPGPVDLSVLGWTGSFS